MTYSIRCPVCLTDMDLDFHEPRLMPLCGHSICLKCLENILQNSRDCPICRTKFENPVESAFPQNIYVRSIIQEYKNVCDTHNSPLDYLCLTCKKLLCSKCYIKSPHEEHQVEAVSEFYAGIQNTIDSIKTENISL